MKVNGCFWSPGYFCYFQKRQILFSESDTFLFKVIHVRPEGYDPPTFSLKGSRSTN